MQLSYTLELIYFCLVNYVHSGQTEETQFFWDRLSSSIPLENTVFRELRLKVENSVLDSDPMQK